MQTNFENLNSLHIGISTAFQDGLHGAQPSEWPAIAARMGSSSSSNVYPFLRDDQTGMREWIGERRFSQLSSLEYTIKNRKFEKSMIGRLDDIRDDAGGLAPLLADRARMMADACARHPDELVIGEGLRYAHQRLCYDEQFFFDSDHPVGQDGAEESVSNDMGGSGVAWYLFCTTRPLKPLIYQVREALTFSQVTAPDSEHVFKTDELMWGAKCRDNFGYGLWQCAIKSKQTLDETNFLAARARMESFCNDAGVNLGLTPNLLFCSRYHRDIAARLFKRSLVVESNAAVDNYLQNAIDVKVSNYLPITAE